jgi:hypothetical protein
MYLSWTNIICKVSTSRKQHSRDDSMKTNIWKHPSISLGPKTRVSLIMEPSKEIRILIAWDVTSRLLMNKCRMCLDRYKTYHWCKILSVASCSLCSLLSFNWVQDWHSSNSLQSAFWRASPGFCLFPQEDNGVIRHALSLSLCLSQCGFTTSQSMGLWYVPRRSLTLQNANSRSTVSLSIFSSLNWWLHDLAGGGEVCRELQSYWW